MANANMEKAPILSARDVEIQFSLRGKKLKAIRKCSLDLIRERRSRSWASLDQANRYLQSPFSACLMRMEALSAEASSMTERILQLTRQRRIG